MFLPWNIKRRPTVSSESFVNENFTQSWFSYRIWSHLTNIDHFRSRIGGLCGCHQCCSNCSHVVILPSVQCKSFNRWLDDIYDCLDFLVLIFSDTLGGEHTMEPHESPSAVRKLPPSSLLFSDVFILFIDFSQRDSIRLRQIWAKSKLKKSHKSVSTWSILKKIVETTPTSVTTNVLNAFRFPSSTLFNHDVIRALNIASNSPGIYIFFSYYTKNRKRDQFKRMDRIANFGTGTCGPLSSGFN